MGPPNDIQNKKIKNQKLDEPKPKRKPKLERIDESSGPPPPDKKPDSEESDSEESPAGAAAPSS